MTPEQQLRYFAEDVGLTVALEQGGKISIAEAFRRIQRRYKNLKKVVKDIDDGRFPIS